MGDPLVKCFAEVASDGREDAPLQGLIGLCCGQSLVCESQLLETPLFTAPAVALFIFNFLRPAGSAEGICKELLMLLDAHKGFFHPRDEWLKVVYLAHTILDRLELGVHSAQLKNH